LASFVIASSRPSSVRPAYIASARARGRTSAKESTAELIEHVFTEHETEVEFDDGGLPAEIRGRIVHRAILAVQPETGEDFSKLADAGGNGAK
jgi:hypothetical protein